MNRTEALKTVFKLVFGIAAAKLGIDANHQAEALDLAVTIGGAALSIYSAVKLAVPAVRRLVALLRPAQKA